MQDAEEKLKHYQMFVKKGFGTPEQMRLKELEVEKARNYLERDKAKLVVLEKYTKKRQEAELHFKAEDARREVVRTKSTGAASIAKAKSDLESARVVADLEKEQSERLRKQLELTVIKAPEDGILVYSQSRYWDPALRVQVGGMVMYQQALFQLPELDHMQVKVRIHESKVKKIEEGQKAEIRVESYPNRVLHGTVTKVATLSDSADSWRRGGVKEYETIVTIDDLPDDAALKPGMTAEVAVKVKQLSDVLLVPVQAVTEIEGQHFVYIVRPGGIERREVRWARATRSSSRSRPVWRAASRSPSTPGCAARPTARVPNRTAARNRHDRCHWEMIPYRLLHLVRLSLQSVFLHRLRSTLTMLGIVLGVGSVIVMLAVGEAARFEAVHRFRSWAPPTSSSAASSRWSRSAPATTTACCSPTV